MAGDDNKNSGKETVEQFLARAGQIETIEAGESGVHHPIRRNRKAQINFLKHRDFLRKKKGETL